MNLFSRILVGIGGGDASDRAAVLATHLAREHGGELIFCHAVNWLPLVTQLASSGSIIDAEGIVAEMKDAGHALLERCAGAARSAGRDVHCRMVEGEPAESLLDLAQREACTVIVLGNRGGAGGLKTMFAVSSIAAVLRGSTVPVLTVAAGMKNPACGRRTFEQIIVGVDGSEPAQAALETVFALPAEDLRQVFFYTVAGDNAVEYEHAERIIGKAVAEAQERGVAVKGIVLAGRPNDVLVAAAKQRDADLIVLGSHGRRGLRRLFLGSVAEDVVRHSAVPVLVVRSRSRTAAAGKAVTVEAREPQAAVR